MTAVVTGVFISLATLGSILTGRLDLYSISWVVAIGAMGAAAYIPDRPLLGTFSSLLAMTGTALVASAEGHMRQAATIIESITHIDRWSSGQYLGPAMFLLGAALIFGLNHLKLRHGLMFRRNQLESSGSTARHANEDATS